MIPLPLWLVLAAPVSAIFVGFFIVRPLKPSWTHLPMILSCAVVTACAAALAARAYAGWGVDQTLYTWARTGAWTISFGLRLDGLSATILLLVSLVGALIHIYASGYMKEDPSFSRFFLLFHFFYLAMIGLVLSNNYVQLYLFWELVGAASFFLIGFWYQKQSARAAALKAFLANRVGDFAFTAAVIIILVVGHDARFSSLFAQLPALAGRWRFWAALGLLLAAAAKSAQLPLYFWLPDAMEGPTPVSALMHAATMVTAGVFLLARSWPLIAGTGVTVLIAAVGAATSLFAAIIASTRRDLKRILAYSTVSHLGLMTFALGLGLVGAAVFHLVVHGFFKAVLFLCAGQIAHGLGKPTVSIDEVGEGLWRKMPLTGICFLAAALSLAGFWPFAGFYSKEAILDEALKAGPLVATVGLTIGFFSAFYIFRMFFLTFFGKGSSQKPPEHVHEAEAVMGVPTLFLAMGAVSVGWAASGIGRLLMSSWPDPDISALSIAPVSLVQAWPGLAAGLLGAAAAYVLTLHLTEWDWDWRRDHPGLERFFAEDMDFQMLVRGVVVAFKAAAEFLGQVWDKGIWDSLIESTGPVARTFSDWGGELSLGRVNDYLWWMAAAAAAIIGWILWR